MESDQADPVKLGFDPFDVTKVWPRNKFPVGPLRKGKYFCAFTDRAIAAGFW